MTPGRGSVSGPCRWLCATLQVLALLAFHGIIAALGDSPSHSAMAFGGELELWDAVAIMSS